MLEEDKLQSLLPGHLFLLPYSVPCEFCNFIQGVSLPVKVVAVEDGLIKGSEGSAFFPCENCGGLSAISWDSVTIELQDFLGE